MPSGEDTVYDFIVGYKTRNNGTSPSFDEIAEGCGLSKSTVNYHLGNLERKHVLRVLGVRNISIPNEKYFLEVEDARD